MDKQEIDREALLKIFAECNSYIVGFDDKEVSKYLEENISQMIRAINMAYKISKSNFVWLKKMEENKKKGENSALIVLIIILVAIASSALSIVIYRQILIKNGEEPLSNSLQQDVENLQTLGNSVENTNSTNESDNAIRVEAMVNGEKAVIEMMASFTEAQMQDGDMTFYEENVDVTINGKSVDSIITYTWTNKESYEYIFPEVKKIKDIVSGNEYILLVSYPESITGNSSNSFIIYDYNGKKITEISDYAGTTYTLVESGYTIPAHTIKQDSIEIVQPNSETSGAELYSYTIENGEIKSNLIKSYTAEELESAGKV